MLYLTCTMISSVDLAHYGISRATVWVSENCGTTCNNNMLWWATFGTITTHSGFPDWIYI